MGTVPKSLHELPRKRRLSYNRRSSLVGCKEGLVVHDVVPSLRKSQCPNWGSVLKRSASPPWGWLPADERDSRTLRLLASTLSRPPWLRLPFVD